MVEIDGAGLVLSIKEKESYDGIHFVKGLKYKNNPS